MVATTYRDSIYGDLLGEETYTWYRNGIMIENATGDSITESPVTVEKTSPATYILLKFIRMYPAVIQNVPMLNLLWLTRIRSYKLAAILKSAKTIQST